MQDQSNGRGVYHFFVTLPDRVYPFRAQVEGQWVRGLRSYNEALARAFDRYGTGHFGYKLTVYRNCFHLAGSLTVLYVAAFVAAHFLGGTAALTVLLAIATLLIVYQEFFFQRRVYRQSWTKGITDTIVWTLPMAAFLLLSVR